VLARCSRVEMIIFGLVQFLLKKSNQTDFFFKNPKPNRNRFKPTGFGSVWFSFLGKKPIQTGFFGLARFFFYFFFDLGSFRFSFFSSRLIKPKPNRPVFSKF
jgi:hypothetical protein